MTAPGCAVLRRVRHQLRWRRPGAVGAGTDGGAGDDGAASDAAATDGHAAAADGHDAAAAAIRTGPRYDAAAAAARHDAAAWHDAGRARRAVHADGAGRPSTSVKYVSASKAETAHPTSHPTI